MWEFLTFSVEFLSHCLELKGIHENYKQVSTWYHFDHHYENIFILMYLMDFIQQLPQVSGIKWSR